MDSIWTLCVPMGLLLLALRSASLLHLVYIDLELFLIPQCPAGSGYQDNQDSGFCIGNCLYGLCQVLLS